jgi:hypothetical protein
MLLGWCRLHNWQPRWLARAAMRKSVRNLLHSSPAPYYTCLPDIVLGRRIYGSLGLHSTYMIHIIVDQMLGNCISASTIQWKVNQMLGNGIYVSTSRKQWCYTHVAINSWVMTDNTVSHIGHNVCAISNIYNAESVVREPWDMGTQFDNILISLYRLITQQTIAMWIRLW